MPTLEPSHFPSYSFQTAPVTPTISIVVVNYNGATHLPRLLSSIKAQSYQDFELILVDNASVDDSMQLLQTFENQSSLPTRLLRNEQNIGFASACNQAIALASGKWIALLNNDAFPEPSWLGHLIAATKNQHDVGMVGTKLLFEHAPERINSAGIAIDWAGIAWDWRGGELDQPDEETPIEIFGPCGGAALYSKKMIDDLGGFDEDFFAYLEDVDLAWRARLAGWRSILEPRARVYHVHSATLGNTSPYKNYLLGRNKVWLLTKNYPSPWFFLFLPIIIAYDLMSVLYGSVRTRNVSAIKGRWDGLKDIPLFWKKRRRIQARWRHVKNWQQRMAPLEFPVSIIKRYKHL